MSLAVSGNQLIVKNGVLATNCCCKPYIIASIVLESGEIWDTSEFAGPGIATQGGDYWRIAEIGYNYTLASGCVKEDGELNNILRSFNSTPEEGLEVPEGYGGAFEIQIGCWQEDEIKWPE